MDKCREAFEQLPVIEEIMGDDYVMFDEQFKKYLCGVGANEEYLNGAWMAWQSRQAELDQAYEDIETFVQAHQRECDIKVQIANELKEKDKRIEEACESINSFFDNQVSTPTPREYANFIAEILEVLRGEHE